MVRLNVRSKSDRGITLIETLITLVVAGVLAAFTLPGMMGILKGNELKAAQDQVQAALRDAQRQAIRRSKKCTVTFNLTDNPVTITSTDSDCLGSTDRTLPRGITLTSSGGSSFTYSYKGHTNNAATLTLSSSGSNVKRCIAVAANLGIMRSGVIDSRSNCVTSSSNL